MKQSDWILTIAGVFVLLWVFSSPNVGPAPVPPDDDKFPKPVGIFAEVPLASKYISGDSAGDLAWFWRNFAIQFKEDDQITNTAMARNMHVHAGKALRRLLGEKVYSLEFADDIEKFFDRTVGMDNKNIDAATREKIYQAFMAVAWSCNEAADSSLLSSTGKKDNSQCMSAGCVEGGCLLDSVELVNFIHQIDPKGPGKFYQIDANGVRGPPEEDLTKGLIFDEQEVQEFIQQIPDFKEFGFEGTWGGKERLLYRSLKKFDPGAYESERQTVGDCTSHATRNACDTVRAFEIDVLRESEDFVARGATEAIYGARGHAGQGMSIVAAVKFVSENGGVALRRKYDQVDLSVYNSNIGTEWGRNRDGTPVDFRQLLQSNQVTKVSHISSVKDAADAIYSGFALTVGSNYSFSNTRDQYGIAKRTPQGWAHAMAWVAVTSAKDLMSPEGLEQYLRGEYAIAEADGLVVDFPRAEDDPCFLIVNSWGTWNNGPKGKYDIPEGSFWITADNAAGMIKQQQAFALGNFEGFAPQSLDDWGFRPWLGTKNINYEIVEPSTYHLAP